MQTLRLLFCLLLASSATAQLNTTAPNSREPSALPFHSKETAKSSRKTKFYAPQQQKTSRYKKPRVQHTAQYEFYERVEKAAKEKQRILRILSKRAYSDPRYFGHKRIPKRRPPHKMKFCDECHIRH